MTDIEKQVEETLKEKLPFESWERLPDEPSSAFSAFCTFRDFGGERNIRKAIATIEKDDVIREKRYRVWRNYAAKYRWSERVADYDRYIDGLKQTENRKTIEAQGELQREVTEKMLGVVKQKLDTMNPADLTPNQVVDWMEKTIKTQREMWQSADADCLGVSTSRNSANKQSEFNFVSDFQGL